LWLEEDFNSKGPVSTLFYSYSADLTPASTQKAILRLINAIFNADLRHFSAFFLSFFLCFRLLC